jgi:hypothetical protein
MMASAAGGGVESRLVTRAEYLENGGLASRKKLLDWKSAEDLENAVYEKFSRMSDRDEDVLGHKENDIGAGSAMPTTNKEKDTRRDGSASTGTAKGSGRTKNRRDDQHTPRVDDPSSQVENPHQAPSAGGRMTRTRSTRASMAGISK